MSKQTEALKLALDALEGIWNDGLDGYPSSLHRNAITAIREALAEQPARQQEPVAIGFIHRTMGGVVHDVYHDKARKLPEGFKSELYTSPPASKPWVGLTDEEIKRMAAPLFMSHYWNLCNEFARAIEAKLREKNA